MKPHGNSMKKTLTSGLGSIVILLAGAMAGGGTAADHIMSVFRA